MIKKNQEIEIHLSKSEIDKKEIAMGYAFKLLKLEKYVIEIMQLNETTKTTFMRDFHLTTVPWSADKENLTWYVEKVERSESGMKIYIPNVHRPSIGIGFHFENVEVNAKIKVYINKGVDILKIVSIIVAVVVVILILCLINKCRNKKRIKQGELELKKDSNHDMLKKLAQGFPDYSPSPLLSRSMKTESDSESTSVVIEKSHLDLT